jgi:hypothetical protein
MSNFRRNLFIGLLISVVMDATTAHNKPDLFVLCVRSRLVNISKIIYLLVLTVIGQNKVSSYHRAFIYMRHCCAPQNAIFLDAQINLQP